MAISISIPGSKCSPSTSDTNPTGKLLRVGGSKMSTTTIWPGLAGQGRLPEIRISWLMRGLSGLTKLIPLSRKYRPTNCCVARSTISTNEPSGRPRLSQPAILTNTISPSNTRRIWALDKKISSPSPVSGETKPNPSECPITLPLTKLSFSRVP